MPDALARIDRLDSIFLRMQIEALKLSFPEVWDDGDEALLADMLEAETDLHEFLTAVVARMREALAFAGGMDQLIADLQARQRRYQRRGDAMRELTFRLMTAAAVQKVELAQATLSIRAGTPKVIITDADALPAPCVRIRREPDKIAIKDMLARGLAVPGAELSNSEPVLAVRVK